MKKKLLSVVLASAMAMSLVACGSKPATEANTATEADTTAAGTTEDSTEAGEVAADPNFKVGVIVVGDENEGYTYAHLKGVNDAAEALGLSKDQVIVKYNTPEDTQCYDAAVDLAEQGCGLIIGNSFGHEDYLIQAATEYPDVQFSHATGYKAATCGLDNMHNYFTDVYESRYVSGVVAGLKLNELLESGEIKEAKVGYIGAFSYAEVISGYTSFFLGVRSVCPDATMEVKYTGSWADQALEKETAEALIADGCVLISQHADTTGAASACEAAKVYDVGYNISMIDTAPNYALTSASIDWAPYYTYAIKSAMAGVAYDTDWCQGYNEGADKITELNTAAVAAGTEEKVAEVETAIKDGSLKVFSTSTFTVNNGSTLEDMIASGDENYAKYADYVSDGYFHESELASAPAFDIRIDGITELNTVY